MHPINKFFVSVLFVSAWREVQRHPPQISQTKYEKQPGDNFPASDFLIQMFPRNRLRQLKKNFQSAPQRWEFFHPCFHPVRLRLKIGSGKTQKTTPTRAEQLIRVS